jgi:perosamine synthetase
MTAHSSASADYRAAVVRSFAWLKDTASATEASARAIPLAGDIGQLVPVGHGHPTDERLIATLARWRETYMHLYPTQFRVTLDGTAAWLKDRVLAVPDRVMLLVLEPGGRLLGHAGLAEALNDDRAVTLDNVVRGGPGGPPGIMSAAVRALLQWARVNLDPQVISVRPGADNERMIGFVKRLGFRDEGHLIPLRRVVTGEHIAYVPRDPSDDRPPDRYQNRLIYRGPGFEHDVRSEQAAPVGGHRGPN